ncbi:MAG: hypothetical protein VX438_10595, partial [Planctomycetota bacterium]|nr:hypothetical protein [Planctomycetota bacterium]
MNPTNWLLLYLVAAVGHLAIWIGLFNRLHATHLKNKFVRRTSYPFFAVGILLLPLILFYSQYSGHQLSVWVPAKFWELPGLPGKYVYFCLGMAVCTIGSRVVYKVDSVK